ncbi:hypothetical protein ACVDG8_034185 [Mesorhizobium sp. ORM8.1]
MIELAMLRLLIGTAFFAIFSSAGANAEAKFPHDEPPPSLLTRRGDLAPRAFVGKPQPKALSTCEGLYAEPFAQLVDVPPRPCPAAKRRDYRPHNHGFGFELLDLESEACFVSDESYRLLDDIVDSVVAKMSAPKAALSESDKVLAISRATSDEMEARGFALHIPTNTLGDALYSRDYPGSAFRHLFDCDTGSMILITVADTLSVPARLVEISLPGGDQHNYVEWPLHSGASVDWDMNGRSQCVTPPSQPAYQAYGMPRDEALGYGYFLRYFEWKDQGNMPQEIADLEQVAKRRPNHPVGSNLLAWLIATESFPGRERLKGQAVEAASRAAAILPMDGDVLDTFACAQAFSGDFKAAAKTEADAIRYSSADHKRLFQDRIKLFESPEPSDCTGVR